MIERILKSFDKKIHLKTNSQEFIQGMNCGLIEHIIPAFSNEEFSENSDEIFAMEYIDSDDKRVEMNKKNCFVSARLNKDVFIPNMAYLVKYIFQTQNLCDQRYFVHAASVTKNEKTVLILGETNSGKTSVSLELCLEKGFDYIGDDTLLVDMRNKCVLAGNKKMRIVLDDLHVCEKLGLEYNPNKKTVFDVASAKGLFEINREPKQISMLVYVKLAPWLAKVKELSTYDAKLALFRELSDVARASGYGLLNLDYSFPSMDTEEYAKERIKIVHSVIDDGVLSYSVTGTKKSIAKFIYNKSARNE